MAKSDACPICGCGMIVAKKVPGGKWETMCICCGWTGPIRETSDEALEAWAEMVAAMSCQIAEAGAGG